MIADQVLIPAPIGIPPDTMHSTMLPRLGPRGQLGGGHGAHGLELTPYGARTTIQLLQERRSMGSSTYSVTKHEAAVALT